MDSTHYRNNNFDLVLLLLLLLLGATTIIAYHRVLFNFFAGDDYCHLAWLAAAAKDPRLWLANFTGPWLGGVVTHFYRPMISIITLGDYFCWKDNATGYHITNLAGLLLASLFLFFIFDSLSRLAVHSTSAKAAEQLRGSWSISAARLWAVASSGMFALYPLHPEAVSWIIGRVDVISTLFYTSSLCFYIWWRTSKKIALFVIAMAAAMLGLLSKEMVVTLPATMFAFELIFGDLADNTTDNIDIIARVLRAFKNTAFFWLVLAAYAAVRRLALGTVIGGYDVSWSFVDGPRLIMQAWLNSLHFLLVPINQDFMSAHNWHTKAWEIFTTISAVTLFAATFANAGARRLFMFLLMWLIASLVPLYNIFAIGNELQGGRFGYLPSAPLSGLLLLGYFFLNAGTIVSWLLRLCVPCFLLLAANVLYINNEAWHSDGVQLSAIEQELSKQLIAIPNDDQVLLLNLPDSIHGAYACHNAVDGMLFRVGAKIDPNRCLAVSRFQNSFPCGYLKESISANANKIIFLWWDPGQMDFVRIYPAAKSPVQPLAHSDGGQEVKSQYLEPGPGISYKRLADGGIYVSSTVKGVRPRIVLTSLIGRNCWDVDFVSMEVLVPPGGSIGGLCGCDLIYANTSNPKLGDLHYRANATLVDQPTKQSVLFALRGDEAWAFGGKITGCAVLLPDQCRMIIKDVQVAPVYNVIPRLSFAKGDYLHSKGFVSLNHQHAQQELQFDALGIAGAKKVIAELSRPNVFFEYANAVSPSNTVGRSFALKGLKGNFVLNYLNREQFSVPGYYGLRLRAIDTTGKNVGLASDHIIVLANH